MLVLSRKQDQTIIIDGNTRVSILQIKGNVVRLGIEAPKEVSILRAEIRERPRSTDVITTDASDSCQIAEMGGCI